MSSLRSGRLLNWARAASLGLSLPLAVPLPAAAEGAAEDRLVAVLDLKHTGQAAALANALAAVLTSEVSAREGHRARSRNELRSILSHQAEAALLGCESLGCMTDIGKLVDADLLISGSLEHLGGAHVIALSLIDPRVPAVVGRVESTWRGPAEEMVVLVRPLVDRLLFGAGAAGFRGGVEVMAPAGTRVFIDGVEVGTTPLAAPVTDLTIGAHLVEVTKAGFVPARTDVVVSRDETTLVRFELEEEPLWTQWWFWTAVGGSAALAVAGGTVLGVLALQPPPTTLVIGKPAAAAAK